MAGLADQLLPLTRAQTWALLIEPAARALWQPGVVRAHLIEGYPGGKGARYQLTLDDGTLEERIINAAEGVSLSLHQYCPSGTVWRKRFTLMTIDREHTRVSRVVARHHRRGPLRPWRSTGQQFLDHTAELDALLTLARGLRRRMANTDPAGEGAPGDPRGEQRRAAGRLRA